MCLKLPTVATIQASTSYHMFIFPDKLRMKFQPGEGPSRGLLCDCEMSAPAPRQQINSQSVCPVSSFTRTPARARVAAVPSSADTARSSCVRAYRGPAPPAAGRPSQVTAPRHRLREITLINTILNMRKCIFRLFNFRKKKYSKIFFAPHFTLERLIFRALKLRAFKEC